MQRHKSLKPTLKVQTDFNTEEVAKLVFYSFGATVVQLLNHFIWLFWNAKWDLAADFDTKISDFRECSGNLSDVGQFDCTRYLSKSTHAGYSFIGTGQ